MPGLRRWDPDSGAHVGERAGKSVRPDRRRIDWMESRKRKQLGWFGCWGGRRGRRRGRRNGRIGGEEVLG